MARNWYRDPVALTLVLVIHGYALAAIASTMLGLGESSVLAILVRALTLLAIAVVISHGVKLARLDGLLMLLWLIYLVRLIYDQFDPRVDSADSALMFFVVTCALPAIALAAANPAWHERHVAIGLITTGALVCLGALVTMRFVPGGADFLNYTGRLGFEKLDPISLGHVGCTTALVALVLSFSTPGWRGRMAIVLAFALGIAVLILAASRGAIIAFSVCSMLLLVRQRRWKYLALGALLLLPALAFVDTDALLQSTRISGTGKDDSSQERKYILALAIRLIQEHWELGSAYTLPNGLGYPHNIFIEAWMAMGVLGFLALVALTLRALLAAYTRVATDQPIVALLFLQFLIGAQFSGSLYGWSGMWVGFALLLAGKRARQPRYDATTSLQPIAGRT